MTCADAAPGPDQPYGGVTGSEPIANGRCEGCEAVFQGLSEELSSAARIAPIDAPGEPLRLSGTVVDGSGDPVPGIVIYAYQTDAEGIYSRGAESLGRAAGRHGRLRSWAQSDSEGRYQFDTIRPASYPGSTIPQHIHLHVIEPGRCTYYIDAVEFTDDPTLTPSAIERRRARGGSGVTTPTRDAAGTWLVERDIQLGAEIADYASCESGAR